MVSVPGRAVGDILNVMALKGRPTNVDIYYGDKKESFSLPQNGRLNVYKEIPSDSLFYIKSDQPLSVTQLTKSKDTYLYKVSLYLTCISELADALFTIECLFYTK